MSSINEQLDIYRQLFDVLGIKIGLTRTVILEYLLKLGNGTEFTIPAMIKDTSIERTLAYAQIRFFHEYGFILIKDASPLPPDFFDWNFCRRRSYKKRTNYPRRRVCVVDFRGVTKTIDERIHILHETRQWLLDNADIPSNTGKEEKP